MKTNKENGITLVALIITIIILLILAGITINLLIGENGLIKIATEAAKKYELEAIKERIELVVLGSYNNEGKLELDILKNNISENIPEATIVGEDFPIIVNVFDYSFEIDKDGKVEFIESNKPEITHQPEVTEVKVVENSDGTGNSIESDSVEEGRQLYISFKASIKEGTIKSVTCDKGTPTLLNGIYVTPITQNGIYKFTIVGNVGGKDYSIIHSVNVDKYEKRSGLKVGDYISYEPDSAQPYTKLSLDNTGAQNNSTSLTQENLNWQILRIYDDGSMDLIGSPTSAYLYLGVHKGYNNGVYLMNDICKSLYSKTSKGIIARSIRKEDFEEWLTDSGREVRDKYTSEPGIIYGGSKFYATNSYYPDIYQYEKGAGINSTTPQTEGIGPSESYSGYENGLTTNTYERADSVGLTVTQTGYELPAIDVATFGEGVKPLTASTVYWIASRYTWCGPVHSTFGYFIGGTAIKLNWLTTTANSHPQTLGYNLRPVVSIGANAEITTCLGANSVTNKHIITQY
ncbi:MAG: hypothetical protein HFJ53_01800 [Clostridia bacterium]|jgi:hypothetical protein|nr:hypothetical protein [Clostridia bacterium]